MLKRLGWLALALAAGWLAWHARLVGYGLGQLRGQLRIVRHAVPVADALRDTTLAAGARDKLALIGAVRAFGFDALGLKRSGSYTRFYDQHGKPVLWVVTACPRFALVPYEWEFPFLGKVSYKGYFEEAPARAERQRLTSLGYDASLSTVGGWSTLGWFDDPVLSGMLDDSPGEVAETILHELTHGTVYLESSVELNENLATFVGEQGALRFLAAHFGAGSPQLHAYVDVLHDQRTYGKYMLAGAARLDSLYRDEGFIRLPFRTKARLKYRLIAEILSGVATLPLHDAQRYRFDFSRKRLPGNPYFMSFLRYRGQQDLLGARLETECEGNLRCLVDRFVNLP